MKEKNIYLAFIVLIFFTIGGFFIVFDSISELKNDIKNFQMTLELLMKERNQEKTNEIKQEKKEEEPKNSTSTIKTEETSIPTAILFETLSSPTLSPQSKISIAIESVSKSSDGTVTVNFKTYTNQAKGYSAIEPRELFGIFSEDEDILKPVSVNGTFNSMPQKSVVSGNVIFKILPSKQTLILQIGDGDNIKFYEFNFFYKTYKETVVG